MQITLSWHQSQILQSLALQGGYASLEDAIDTALVLLADEIGQQKSDETSEYLAWVEHIPWRMEIDIIRAKGNSR